MAFVKNLSFEDWFTFPRWGFGLFGVWKRNFLYFRYSLGPSLFWVLLEPVLYLVAMGYGVGRLIEQVDGMSYVEFFLPALLVSSGMFVAFFEASYGSFTKLTRQKTFATILMTPVSEQEIVLGEIFWAASKGFFSVLGVVFVASVFGHIHSWMILPALGILMIHCWAFASVGMLFAATARNYDSFIYAQSGLIIPMSLFSDTYFPLSTFPWFVQKLALLSPVTHAVRPVRQLLSRHYDWTTLASVGVLMVFALIFTNLAVSKMAKKIYY